MNAEVLVGRGERIEALLFGFELFDDRFVDTVANEKSVAAEFVMVGRGLPSFDLTLMWFKVGIEFEQFA